AVRLDRLPRDTARGGAEAMKTATHYTYLPAELRCQTLNDCKRRRPRTYYGLRGKDASGPAPLYLRPRLE
ncbi:MAG: hypothetical protein ACK53V_14555, partial [Planctomycetota bacterium]